MHKAAPESNKPGDLIQSHSITSGSSVLQASYRYSDCEILSATCTHCRYTLVVLWGIVVPHIAHAQTQTVYGIRLNTNINISGLSSRILWVYLMLYLIML